MEQSSQLSAEQSLKLINETLRDNRMAITKKSGSHFILWGVLLTLVALAVYFLCPTVRKEILWSKRCKDEALRGMVKEVINQVSHSKKWKNTVPLLDENGQQLISVGGSALLIRRIQNRRKEP